MAVSLPCIAILVWRSHCDNRGFLVSEEMLGSGFDFGWGDGFYLLGSLAVVEGV